MTATRQRNDDEILADIRREMRWDPRIDQAPVEVMVADGVVTLTGVVENVSRRLAAFETASRVRGVRGVIDNIEVRVPQVQVKRRR